MKPERTVSLQRLAAELVVVVVGVLIALGVDQAVERRSERALERVYLEALAADLDADLSLLRADLLPGIDERAARAREVIEAMEGGTSPHAAAIAVAIDFAGHLRVFEARRSTYDDLVATGNLRLLRDREVRAAVVRYYGGSNLEPMHELIRNEIWYGYRPAIDEVLDPLFLADLTRLERETEGGFSGLVSAIDGDAARAALDVDALRSSRSFRQGIASVLEYTFVQRGLYRERIDLAERLLRLVA